MTGHFGRREPTDFVHVERYPFTAPAPVTVERALPLPWWHTKWDQDGFGSCVGFGTTMMLAVLNLAQRRAAGETGVPRYDPFWLWNRAKERDDWPDTNPGDNEGTSVRAACDVLRDTGPFVVGARVAYPFSAPVAGDEGKPGTPAEGIATNRWARTVDEMRASIAAGIPISIGVNWYSGMSTPVRKANGEYWISVDGTFEGGHCVCVRAASDRRQAFSIKNSWAGYPLVWVPYSGVEQLLGENGESALVTDK